MLKRRHLGVDTRAPPIGVEVSTPSVDAQQFTDIAREPHRWAGIGCCAHLKCRRQMSTPRSTEAAEQSQHTSVDTSASTLRVYSGKPECRRPRPL